MLLILVVLLIDIQVFAQFKPSAPLNQDENELYTTCKDQFFNEDYVQSYQGFSQLLSLYPREEVFNYYYGACLVKLNNNIKSGIDYLKYAAAKDINPANFYIGLGYHYSYDFNQALQFYEVYKQNAKQKDIVNFEVEQYITMAKHGIDLVKYAYELKVLSTKNINRDNFYYSYNLKDFGGEIIVKTDQFKGKADKEIREVDLMYISDIHNALFFSSYGDSKKNSLDIYMSRKEKDNWSAPQKLPNTINTKYDEAFPFLSEDGITLYYSSKGHNSMGGYDIFKTTWDVKNNVWSEPKNLDFPINTPFDDIMYSVDRYDETAYFASNRDTKNDKITVFRILTEPDPQKRKLETMADIYQNANLQVNPVSMTELTKRQEVRAIAMRDTSSNTIAVITNKDSVDDADVLIQNAIAKLDEKSEVASSYLEYAASTYKLTEIKLNEVKEINRQISQLKNKSDANSAALRDSLASMANLKAIEASELYDISKFFADAAKQTNGLISYYQSEINVLDKTSRNEKSLVGDIKNIDTEIKNINTEFPFDVYLSGLKLEKTQKKSQMDKFSGKNQPELQKLELLNEKILLKVELAKKEAEFDVREKYIYDIKTFENEKIDIISFVKENNIQIKFLDNDINGIDYKITLANEFRQDIEDGLFVDPNLNVSKLNNEIEILKTSVTQNSLKRMAEAQDKILADLTLYSPIVDYDAILYATNDLADANQNNVFVDTEIYTQKYNTVVSNKTIRTGNLISSNDSLREQVKNKEAEFDVAINDLEKQIIINDINKLQLEINQNSDLIKPGLSIENKTDLTKVIISYEEIKKNQTTTEFEKTISETDKLIAESKLIESDIADLKTLDKTGNSLGIKYLEVVKSEIDAKIASNVKDLTEKQTIATPTYKINDVIAELEKALYPNNQNSIAAKLLVDDLQKAKRLFSDAEKQRDIQQKNDLINQGNSIIDRGIYQAIEYFNGSLITMYSDFNAYKNTYNTYALGNEKTVAFFIKAGEYKKNADRLQLEAEETTDDNLKIKKLAVAYKEMELANLYFNYIFDFLADDKKYSNEKIFVNSNETENLTTLTTDLNKIKTVELIVETIIPTLEINPEIIIKLIKDAENIQIKTDKLTSEYQKATPNKQSEILVEINKLNDEIKDKITNLNAEIVKAQKEIIIDNFTQLENENPDKTFTNLETEVIAFNEKANNSLDSKDFYLLNEVIIAGESIIKKQNELLKNKTILSIADNKINELLAASERNVKFVITETQIAANNAIIADSIAQNNNNIDTANNTIAENNIKPDTAINVISDTVNNNIAENNNNIDTANNTIAENNIKPDTVINVISDTVNNNIAENNNVANNNSSFSNSTKDLDGLIAELEKLNYSNKLEEISLNQQKNESEIDENSNKIISLNQKIGETENNSSQRNINELKQDLAKFEKQQSDVLIEQSKSNIELINQLENIVKTGNNKPMFLTDTTYINLQKSQQDQRNSIISYSNFYSAEELLEIHRKAQATENKLMQILLREASNLSPELLAQSNKQNSDPNTNNSSIANNTDYNNFSYDYDVTTTEKLNKIETKIKTLNPQIQENESKMAELESEMENSNTMADYKKIQKELEKTQQKYLKQIKEYASINTELLNIKYNIAEIHYTNNSALANKKITPVSDSISKLSFDEFRESLALFEVIITYNPKIPDKELIEKYRTANKLSNQGIEHINTANNLIVNNKTNDPLVMAYYKSIENENDSNTIAITNTHQDSLYKDTTNLAVNTDKIPNRDTVSQVATNTLTEIDNTTTTTTQINNSLVLEKTEKNIFEANLASLYSDNNPIKNIEQGEELCYRIQIGAYNALVNNDRFKGMSPIFIESIPNSKLLRYMAGLFYSYNSANTSLPVVRSLGYADAFIVAYYQGKRITVYEARQIEERLQRETQESVLVINNQNSNFQNNITNNANKQDSTISSTIVGNRDTTSTSTQIIEATNNANIATETDLKKTTDIFYCVQIGVYREKVGSDRLYNLDPIMYDDYGKGLIRHTFGKYYDLNTAISEQNKIRQLGIKDAFVIAYSNGEKIAINQATSLISQNTSLPQDQIIVNVPVNNNQPEVNNQENIQLPERNLPEVENNQPAQGQKVEYYVQLGAFRSDVGTYIKDSFRRISGTSKLFKLTSNDMIVYRTGVFTTYAAAQTGLANAHSGGIKDAFILAIIDGKRVDIATARAAE